MSALPGGNSPVGAGAQSCPIPTKSDLDVTAHSDKGKALEGVKVQAKGPSSRKGATDAAGLAPIPNIKPGSYQVTGTKAGFTTGKATAVVPAGGKGKAPLVMKSTTNLTVTVVTKTAKPQPIEAAKVDVSSAAVDITKVAERTGPTDKSGKAVFPEMETGPHQVMATKTGFRPATTLVTIKPGKNSVTLQMAGVGTLQGKVVDAGSGNGIGGARVSASGPSKPAPTTSAADGSFTFGEVDAGDYEIKATKDGFAPGSAKTKVTAGSKTPVEVKLTPITVRIRAADGASDPPTAIGITKSIELTGVLNVKVPGTFLWTRSGAAISLKNSDKQKVTVEAGKTPGAAPESEEVQLVFTPKDQPALAPVKHKLSVGTVVFSSEASHPFGYDAFEKMKTEDNNGAKAEIEVKPEKDFVSIEKSKTGKVKVEIKGVKPSDVFFKSANESTVVPKVLQPTANPFVLELDAKAKKKSEADIEARIGSEKASAVAKLGAVVLQEVKLKAELFRVKDSTSAGTVLKHSVTGAQVQTHANDIYKQAVVVWDISGGASETDVEYDLNKNGILDLDPGTDSAEFKKIKAACKTDKGRIAVFYVKKLRMNFFLVKNAKAADTKITVKNVGAHFLGFFGEPQATIIDDNKGNTANVTVKKVNKSTGVIELQAAVGQDFKVSDKAALIFPLAGLSGNPLVVADGSDDDAFKTVTSHELGHEAADFDDLTPVDNFMFGGGDTSGRKLRHRPLPRFRDPKKNDEQWKKVPKRNA